MENKNVTQPQFGKIRGMLWPVQKFELKKFLPMSFMMVCILFVYTLCRDLKDTLMQTCATGGGSATLAPLKLLGVIPFSILFMMAFMKLSNKRTNAQMFYGTITFFLAFFFLFGFVLYPMSDYLHGSQGTLIVLQTKFPRLFWFWPSVTNWTFALAYIMSEIWGTAVISLLFWQFANEITKTTEAPRFYSLFGMIGNIGLIVSGRIVSYFAGEAAGKTGIKPNFETFGTSLKWQMFFVVVSGIGILLIYYWMQKKVITDPDQYIPGGGIKKKEKPKMGVWESIVYICTNPYILLIALLVFSYGMSVNLVEVLWKEQLKVVFPDRNEYQAFMGGVSERTGYMTIPLMIIGTNILRKCKWKTSALVTPVFMLVTSLMFFALLLYKEKAGDATLMNVMGVQRTLVNISAWFGLYQVSCSKGVKYSLFDATKNMAYMPLESEEKLKSQAAVEVVGGRLGKGGGATVVFLLTSIIFSGAKVTEPLIMRIIIVTFVVVMIAWMIAVFGINPKVVKKLAERHKEEKEIAASVVKGE